MDQRQKTRITVFILDMEHNSRELIRRWMTDEGYRIFVFQETADCLDAIAENPPDVLLADVLTTSLAGMEIMERTTRIAGELPVILLYQSRLTETALKSVFQGAFDFHSKPLDRTRLTLSVKNAARVRTLETENRQLRSDLSHRRRSSLPAYADSVGPSMKDLERKAIKDALTATKGNVSKAARTLGLGRTTLYRKMSAFGLGGFRNRGDESRQPEAESAH